MKIYNMVAKIRYFILATQPFDGDSIWPVTKASAMALLTLGMRRIASLADNEFIFFSFSRKVAENNINILTMISAYKLFHRPLNLLVEIEPRHEKACLRQLNE